MNPVLDAARANRPRANNPDRRPGVSLRRPDHQPHSAPCSRASRSDASPRPAPATPKDARTSGRRVILRNVAASPFFLGLFNFAAPVPNNLGVGEFNGIVTGLSLCPPTPNCVGTSDEFNDPVHYIPAWTYNDEEKVKRGGTETTRDGRSTLARVIENTDCDGYAPKIVEQTNDYMRVEYTSKVFGFVDDVEFWFPPDDEKRRSRVEYRSASRVGERFGRQQKANQVLATGFGTRGMEIDRFRDDGACCNAYTDYFTRHHSRR